MEKDKIKLPNHTTFAICSHNGLWPTKEEEKEVVISPYGGVADWLGHEINEHYEDDEDLEVEYLIKN